MANNFQIMTDEKYLNRQFMWIERQIENHKHDSFIDFYQTRNYFEEGQLTRYSSKKILWAFVDEFLSDLGKKRLNTALKVAKKRDLDRASQNRKIEATVDLSTFITLDKLAKKSNLTKSEIIKQLINNEATRTNLFALD